jgi:hypothetical protein
MSLVRLWSEGKGRQTQTQGTNPMKRAKETIKPAIKNACKIIINQTPAGDLGWQNASDMISDRWDLFEAAGAIVGDLESISAFVHWAKLEGFSDQCPIK